MEWKGREGKRRKGKRREWNGREGKGREGKEKAFPEKCFSRNLGWSGIVCFAYCLHRDVSLAVYEWHIRKKNVFYLTSIKLSKVVSVHTIKTYKTMMIQFHPLLIYI